MYLNWQDQGIWHGRHESSGWLAPHTAVQKFPSHWVHGNGKPAALAGFRHVPTQAQQHHARPWHGRSGSQKYHVTSVEEIISHHPVPVYTNSFCCGPHLAAGSGSPSQKQPSSSLSCVVEGAVLRTKVREWGIACGSPYTGSIQTRATPLQTLHLQPNEVLTVCLHSHCSGCPGKTSHHLLWQGQSASEHKIAGEQTHFIRCHVKHL